MAVGYPPSTIPGTTALGYRPDMAECMATHFPLVLLNLLREHPTKQMCVSVPLPLFLSLPRPVANLGMKASPDALHIAHP